LCIKLVIETSLYYDTRQEKHQIMYSSVHVKSPTVKTSFLFQIYTIYFDFIDFEDIFSSQNA
jgi:hypothetical protein